MKRSTYVFYSLPLAKKVARTKYTSRRWGCCGMENGVVALEITSLGSGRVEDFLMSENLPKDAQVHIPKTPFL